MLAFAGKRPVKMRLSVGGFVVGLSILLGGCNSLPEQQRLAIDGVNKFRQEFNSGACQSIYDDADAGFRGVESKQKWASDCEHLRKTFGPWRGFSAVSCDRLPHEPAVLLVAGEAVFAKGEYHLEAYWKVSGARARWYFLSLQRAGEYVCAPRCPGGMVAEIRF